MNKMEWSLWSLNYIRESRKNLFDVFNNSMQELKESSSARTEEWYITCKDILPNLYHYSLEFVDDIRIPGKRYVTPAQFSEGAKEYELFVSEMSMQLNAQHDDCVRQFGVGGVPSLIYIVQNRIKEILDVLNYVRLHEPNDDVELLYRDDIALICNLARRFHDSVISLKKHPYGGAIYNVVNEWDCQYIFRAILKSYVEDLRDEEWGPSVAGTSARCEFFIPKIKTMIELKYVHKPTDAKKIKQELATDILDYGKNKEVENVVFLIYDPLNLLRNPAAWRNDFSGEQTGLAYVHVVISPPRD